MTNLFCGDCLDLMPAIPDGSIDAIVTDLPYGVTACKWDAVIPFAPMWSEVKRVLKPGGAFITTASQPFTSALIMSNPKWFRQELIWRKTVATGFLDANRKHLKAHENIVIFCETGRMTYNPQMTSGAPYSKKQKANRAQYIKGDFGGGVTKSTGYRYPVSVLEFANPNNKSLHPTQKPVALYEYLIRTYTNRGEAVLDICMGSGTTGVAAIQVGRKFTGIELGENFFSIADSRISEAKRKMQFCEVTA